MKRFININKIILQYKEEYIAMARTQFYDRKEELAYLKEKYAHIERTGKGEMIVLYGRRRVGKTELVKQFLGEVQERKLYFYVGLSERRVIFQALASAIQEQMGDVVKVEVAEDFLAYIRELSKREKCVLVLDEFQRFLDVAPEMITSLQNYWDSALKNQRILVLLVGSSIGLMQKIMDSKAGALYGRAQKVKLSPFKYADFREMFKELPPEEKILRYAIFGGTPFYLEKTKRYKDTLESVVELVLKKDAELSEEPKTLMEYEQVKIHAKYNAILQAISSGKEVLKEIQDFTKMPGSHLPQYITRLDRLLDLVRKSDPVLGKGKLGRYRLNDNFFRFWYRFVFPHQTALNLGNASLVKEAIRKNLNGYVGRIFEEVIKELLILYNTKEIKGLRLNFENIGSWWDRNGNEIDVLAYNLKERKFLVGEVKWTNALVGKEVIEELYRKSKLIGYGGEYQFIFASKRGFTAEALEKMKELKAVSLDLEEIESLFDKSSER